MKSAIIILSVCIYSVLAHENEDKRLVPAVLVSGGLTAADSLFNGKVLIGDPNSKDCNAACKSKKFAFGQTIGTGPFCASSCTDCPKGSKCLDNWAEGGLCVFGHKVCCCLKAKKVTRKLDIYNELLGRDSFDSRNNEDSNDQSDE